ncbi:MAG: heterocyst frequency control protein PatD [Cyanobacteriota bacterium]|nr:heterocyst frequency control protein PatD [Cyanobacteriota bacterium]
MLPVLYCRRYEEFLAAIEGLKASLEAGGDVKGDFQQVQQVYRERILTLTSEGIEDAIAPRWQSIQTEMNRAMRLLQTDVAFLGSSRNSAIAISRQSACLARIEQLIGYCRLLVSH